MPVVTFTPVTGGAAEAAGAPASRTASRDRSRSADRDMDRPLPEDQAYLAQLGVAADLELARRAAEHREHRLVGGQHVGAEPADAATRSVRKWTRVTPLGGAWRPSSAATSVRGVAQALPTKTRSPGRTSAIASAAVARRSSQGRGSSTGANLPPRRMKVEGWPVHP